MGGTMNCFVHRDDEGWYVVSEWGSEPVVFRLPDDYDPRDDEAQLVIEMLSEILNERCINDGKPPEQ